MLSDNGIMEEQERCEFLKYIEDNNVKDAVKFVLDVIDKKNFLRINSSEKRQISRERTQELYNHMVVAFGFKPCNKFIWVDSLLGGSFAILQILKPEYKDNIINFSKNTYPPLHEYIQNNVDNILSSVDSLQLGELFPRIMDKWATIRDDFSTIHSQSNNSIVMGDTMATNEEFDRISLAFNSTIDRINSSLIDGDPPMCIDHRAYLPGELNNPDLKLYFELMSNLSYNNLLQNHSKDDIITRDVIAPFMSGFVACWPFDNIVIFSDLPSELYFSPSMGRMVLHKDGGPAIKFPDGFCYWCLNNVEVSKEIAETPSSKLDPHIIVNITNAEVRKVVVEKVGIDRILNELASTVIDTDTINENEYVLVLLDLGDARRRPYLKMKNPSTDSYHIEGVPPETKTVKEALEFRNNGLISSPISLN